VWKQTVNDHQVQGVKVYDARLVAIMTVYSVDSLLTFNSADFHRFKSVQALHPSTLDV
jgi:predicted nucleic acid-binding protein